MPVLSPAQIRDYAYAAGFRGADLSTAVAVALAESGGNTQAYNPELASSYSRPGGGSRGLWQIFGSVHPEYNSSIAFDPATNARGAYEIYRAAGSKFTPWSAYKVGSYRQYLGQVPGGQPSPISSGLAGGIEISPGRAAGTVETVLGFSGPDIPGIAQTIMSNIGKSILGQTSEGIQRTTSDLVFFLAGFALVGVGLIALIYMFGREPVSQIAGAAVKTAL